MGRLISRWLLVMIACCGASALGSESPSGAAGDITATAAPLLLGLPGNERPLVVEAAFQLSDINDIDDTAETFEFSGVLTLRWRDPRQGFDPEIVGVSEKIFQGAFQFDEMSPGWYPQVVLVNEAGLFQQSGVLLRVQPDGSSTLVQTINAVAEADFDLRLFPVDEQRLEARFEILGFDRDEVRLQPAGEVQQPPVGQLRIPEWGVNSVTMEVRERAAGYAGSSGITDSLLLTMDVERDSWYARRLVMAPLVLIVLLSFSVFWMDRSSLGDRQSISFIGILSAVSYQIVTSTQLPRIGEPTLIHGFLNVSFLTMCATVLVNLLVGAMDKRGRFELGDLIDKTCRWVFPLGYIFLIAVTITYFELMVGG